MNLIQRLFPIFQWLPAYKKADLNGDLFAGLTVGVMLIPQGMAYALIAGLPPVYGLYASIVPQIIYALLGTSRQLSVAPVAMDSLLVAAGVSVLATEGSDSYIAFAILIAFFMGAFQLLLGVFRLGFITNLLSKPVISGFTSAAALIIGFNQLKYLLGTDIAKSNRFYEVVINSARQIDETHVITLIIGIAAIVLIKSLKSLNKNIPGALIAVIVGTVIVYSLRLDDVGVSIVQNIPQGLPSMQLPDFSLGQFGKVLPLAFTISVVAFMEAFSVAKAVEAKRRDHKVIPNQELIGLGAANLIGSLFQSYPVTGGFSRTAVNHQAGANTPLASIVSAVIVALTVIFLTSLFYFLPHAILAAIIMVAVSNLFDLTYAKKLWRESKKEFLVLLFTFLVTLNIGMVIGIVTGIILSILLFLYRAAYPHIARLGRIKGHHEFRNVTRFNNLETWEGLVIIRIDAPLSFINIQEIKDYIQRLLNMEPKTREIIIDAGPVSHLDATAADGLHTLLEELNQKGVRLVFCDVIGPVRDAMKQTGLTKTIGKENLFLSLSEAVENALTNAKDPYKKVTLQTNVKA
ncbi:solute carrier family 26 protein [Ekhidna sp.]|jgi:SulP family sulfate permease|uniref:SulP family inorganic anion transporter n=1 Tax=Ekhidna sp. TaxID=2608089 RepID=UPI0032EB7961